ncbi:unnamed protein product, partial [marine sediment metagenome]
FSYIWSLTIEIFSDLLSVFLPRKVPLALFSPNLI